MGLKLIQGSTIEEQLQSIDSHLDALQTRRYSLAKDSVPAQTIPAVPLSIVIPAGKVGIKAIAMDGNISSVSCVNPINTKDTVFNATLCSAQNTTITKLSIPPGTGVLKVSLPLKAGTDIQLEILPPADIDICVGLVFTPTKLGA